MNTLTIEGQTYEIEKKYVPLLLNKKAVKLYRRVSRQGGFCNFQIWAIKSKYLKKMGIEIIKEILSK